jgi:hypothetical protein
VRTKKTYVLRVEVEYAGDAPKPRIHRLRKWLLHCIWNGPPFINQEHCHKTSGFKNAVTLNVACAGCRKDIAR